MNNDFFNHLSAILLSAKEISELIKKKTTQQKTGGIKLKLK